MGLVAEEEAGGGRSAWGRWELLADAGGLEEDLGSMQLNAAGTRAGLTALQLSSAAQGAGQPPPPSLLTPWTLRPEGASQRLAGLSFFLGFLG